MFGIYGHCSGYHIKDVVSLLPALGPRVKAADVYVAGREYLLSQQQQQHATGGALQKQQERKGRRVSLFRGFELNDDYEGRNGGNNRNNTNVADGEDDEEGQQSVVPRTEGVRSQSLLERGTFAHVVIEVNGKSNSTKKENTSNIHDTGDENDRGTLGFFSNGAVVSFGLQRSTVIEIISLFRDCEQQDGILFPERRGWRHQTPEFRAAAPLEISAVQEFLYTTIANLPALGYDVPREVEEMSQQISSTTASSSPSSSASATTASSSHERSSNNSDVESLSATATDIPPFIGYFAADSLSAIVVPDSTVEAQLPFMHALAESVEVEALSAALGPIALRSQVWRDALERDTSGCSSSSGTFAAPSRRWLLLHPPLFRIASKSEVRTTYLQALRLSALCARCMSRSGVFWTTKHAPQRITYECAYEHLEVQHRLALVKRQIETVSGTVSYLGEQLRTDTDEWHEWMIVFLILLSLYVSLR